MRKTIASTGPLARILAQFGLGHKDTAGAAARL
jgi:hypothetical protein